MHTETISLDHNLERANRHNFRASLEALARPGAVYLLEPVLGSGLLAMASLLLFGETTYFYQGNRDFGIIRATCGTTSARVEEADYIFADKENLEILQKAKEGASESPELGATLLFGWTGQEGRKTGVCLSGPGVQGILETSLPLSPEFIRRLQEKNEQFPLGVDLYLIGSDHSLLGLPRTTRIEVLP